MVAVLGILAIVGSGGGALQDWFIGPIPPWVDIDPPRLTVQVGDSAVFSATPFGTAPFTYQWRRNGVDIPGATGSVYTLDGANLGDDGAQFSVVATNAVGSAMASSRLFVSSMPAVVYEDGEFPIAQWVVAASGEPASNGPTHVESQSLSGGNPDAFRSIVYEMPAGPSSIQVFHASQPSIYDPAAQGAIYKIDLALDCHRLSTTTLSQTDAWPMLEQGGRRYLPREWSDGCLPIWSAQRLLALGADAFVLSTGPACAPTEACPDFSAAGAPIQFGFTSAVAVPGDAAAGSVVQGIDNWRVTVWRR